MNVGIHNVESIQTTQHYHKFGGGFYCMDIVIKNKDGHTHSVRLFSSKPITVPAASIEVVE